MKSTFSQLDAGGEEPREHDKLFKSLTRWCRSMTNLDSK